MELKALIGVLLVTGFKEHNHVGRNQILCPFDGCSLCRSAMTNRRISFFMTTIHLDNSGTRVQRLFQDRLAPPMRALWNARVTACKSCYVLGLHLTIDEQLLAFRGNCTFRKYLLVVPLCTYFSFDDTCLSFKLY